MKNKFSKKQELDAEIRNKLALPLTILNSFMDGKKVSRQSIELAIKELEGVLRVMDGKR